MKVSEVTANYIIDYLRIDEPSDIERTEIEYMLSSAKSRITSYTGLTLEELDAHEDITDAMLLIISDSFDNRNLYIEGKASNLNKSVECILNMHSINLL